MIKYTIKSTNEDGTYYLVNGWYKYFAFWKKDISTATLFNRPCDAKRSLTNLLKIMPEYRFDTFELIEVTV